MFGWEDFGAVLRRRAFRRLWLGVMLSRTGDQFTVVALSWLVLDRAGPGVLGIVLMFFGLPALFAGPVAGRFLDRYQPRSVMGLDNVARAALIGVVPVLNLLGMLEVWHLYLVALGSGLLSPVTEVGESVLVPELAADEHLETANSLVSANWEVGALVGPVLAGILVENVGISFALFVDAVSFLAMSAVAFSLPRVERNSTNGQEDSSEEGVRSGFRVLTTLPAVGFLVFLGVAVLLLEGMREVLLPVFSREVLSAGASGYGLLVSALGLGSLLGLAVVSPLSRRVRPGLAMGAILVTGGLLFVPLGFTEAFPVALGFVFLSGFALAPFYVVSRTLMQRLVPGHLRGRVFGVSASFGAAGFPVGAAVGGILLGMISAANVVLLVALALVALGIAAWIQPALQSRT